MDIEEIKSFIESNKGTDEVKQLIDTFNPLRGLTKEKAHEFIEQNDVLKSYRDSHTTKSIDTWKQNNLNKILDEEIGKRFPPETPEQKRLRELETELNKIKNEKIIEANKNLALSIMSQKSLPVDLVDMFVSTDDNQVKEKLAKFEKIFASAVQTEVEKRFKENRHSPEQGSSVSALTKETLSKMSTEEINKRWKENPKQFENIQ